MNTKENAMPLKPSNNATYVAVSGVTYFKLLSEFNGDYTKHCGLLGEEIDKNFYFLRGYDIESVEVDENRNLILHRVDKDYEPIVVNIGEELGQPTFEFDKDNGIITVTYPDGEKATMEGFLVEGKDIRIATDSTLKGNGTMYDPLRLAEVEKTGTYAPAKILVDLTDDIHRVMPEGKGKGYRVVTKENVDTFGMLYPFETVQMINERLKSEKSQWRIPSKADWDELLNAVEPTEAAKDHNGLTVGYYGCVAGAALKSVGTVEEGTGLWKEFVVPANEDPTYGQDTKGLSILPLGDIPPRNEMMIDTNDVNDAEGFGYFASLWTSDSVAEDPNQGYAKSFVYNRNQVKQSSIGKDAHLSVRFVKDYQYGNYNEMETIMGLPYPCQNVAVANAKYNKIWTTVNFYDNNPFYSGETSSQWSAATDSDRGVKVVYFINEWDGSEWNKKPMNEGDSVVIMDYEDAPYHEWRIINGELVDTVKAIMDEFADELSEINNKIDELSGITADLREDLTNLSASTMNEIERLDARDAELQDSIDAEAASRKKRDDELQDSIDAEVVSRKKRDDELQASIDTETASRKKRDDELQASIDTETASRKKRDDELQKSIDDEVEARKRRDNELDDRINVEAASRKKRDDELQASIDAEVVSRKKRDDELQDSINAEAASRKKRDDELQASIDAEVASRKKRDDELQASIDTETESRKKRDNELQESIDDEVEARKKRDDELQKEIDDEIANRIANDIKMGDYVLEPNDTMAIPTNGTDEKLTIRISDNFFDFGEI